MGSSIPYISIIIIMIIIIIIIIIIISTQTLYGFNSNVPNLHSHSLWMS